MTATGPRLAKKVLLIGWDAADWQIITPLLDRGLMPTLEGLINRGVMGNITTLRPIYSPMIWNSIGTGVTPDKHGILGFAEPDPVTGGVRPSMSTTRKVKAVWNMLQHAGLKSGVVGWFAGHPAEPIDGVVVSPSFAVARLDTAEWGPVPDGAVHPPRLVETMADLRVHPTDITPATILPFVPRAAEMAAKKDLRLALLAKHLAECATVHNAATWILEHEPWDFMAVYYDTIDHVCHGFAPYHPPRMADVPEEDFEVYQDVVNGTYRFHDMMLERLLHLAGPDTTVLLLSDHGFLSDHRRPKPTAKDVVADPALWHRPQGILCMAGPGIRHDERIYGASVLDITPTVLTLFGLPVGADMDGMVLAQAFEAPPAVSRIPSWEAVDGECGMHPPDQRVDPATSQALIEQFVALGYMEAPSGAEGQAAKKAVDQIDFNLARVYLSTRRPQLARPVLEALVARATDPRYRVTLAQCLIRLGEPDRAREVLAPFLDGTAPEGSAFVDWLLALTSAQRAQPDTALEHLLRMQERNPGEPALHARTGAAFLHFRRWDDARASFDQALALDPEFVPALLGLAAVRLRTRDAAGAAEAALEAVGLEHATPLGHYLLGVSLAMMGQFDRAALALEMALSFAPRMTLAWRWLVRIHARPGGDPRAAALCRARLRLLRPPATLPA